MKIVAPEMPSFVDYLGKIAAVVFTPGCNLDCFYCHNRMLLGNGKGLKTIPHSKEIEYLRKRQGLLDAVVITGGEPTLQPGLADFICEVRAMDYLVKLDTNGTNPSVLAALIGAELLDYVAMDVKAPEEQYDTICGVSVDKKAINASMELLLSNCVDYEFRTTVIPQLSKTDILAIGRRIRGARSYVLQQYRRPEPVLLYSDPRLDDSPHPAIWITDVVEELDGLVQHCSARGLGIVRDTVFCTRQFKHDHELRPLKANRVSLFMSPFCSGSTGRLNSRAESEGSEDG